MPYCLLEAKGIALPVIEACCNYRKPVKYDELVQIETQIGNVSQSKIRLEYNVWIQGEKLPRADGYTVHCYVNVSGKPVRAPHALVSFFKKAAQRECERSSCPWYNARKGGKHVKSGAAGYIGVSQMQGRSGV